MASVQHTTTLKGRHLANAELFRDEAKRIESLYSDSASDGSRSSIPDDDMDRHMAYCMNSVISTVCFLESTINSLFWDIWDDVERIDNGEDPVHYPEIPGDERQAVVDAEQSPPSGQKKLSNRLENAGILGKYNIFLDVIGQDEFDRDETPVEPVARVLDIRNELVHFEPRWIEGGGKTETNNEYDFEESLQDRFELNPLMASGNAFFPSQCMSYGCAEWAIRVSRGFVRQFSMRIDRQIHPDLPLPY